MVVSAVHRGVRLLGVTRGYAPQLATVVNDNQKHPKTVSELEQSLTLSRQHVPMTSLNNPWTTCLGVGRTAENLYDKGWRIS
jgi:hypothetical protein